MHFPQGCTAPQAAGKVRCSGRGGTWAADAGWSSRAAFGRRWRVRWNPGAMLGLQGCFRGSTATKSGGRSCGGWPARHPFFRSCDRSTAPLLPRRSICRPLRLQQHLRPAPRPPARPSRQLAQARAPCCSMAGLAALQLDAYSAVCRAFYAQEALRWVRAAARALAPQLCGLRCPPRFPPAYCNRHVMRRLFSAPGGVQAAGGGDASLGLHAPSALQDQEELLTQLRTFWNIDNQQHAVSAGAEGSRAAPAAGPALPLPPPPLLLPPAAAQHTALGGAWHCLTPCRAFHASPINRSSPPA